MWAPLFVVLSLTTTDPFPERAATADAPAFDGTGTFEPVAARGVHMTPAISRSLSKKETWLRDKDLRPDYRLTDNDLSQAAKETAAPSDKGRRRGTADWLTTPSGRAGSRILPITTLFNVWTHEALPVLPGAWVEERFHRFLRDHYTNQATWMDTRLIGVLAGAARRFSADRIEIVSGYRSPKYNLMLRKKGHQVARQSQHTEGHAVDFRIPGVPTQTLLGYVRSLRLGGVGFYPHSRFVHSDTGRVRFWKGS